MEKKSPALLFRPVSSLYILTTPTSATTLSNNKLPSESEDLLYFSPEKENTPNQLAPKMSFISRSSDDSDDPNTDTSIEDTSTPTVEKKPYHTTMQPYGRRGLTTTSLNDSIDEAFLTNNLERSASFLSSSTDGDSLSRPQRPSISEAAYLMKSFSTDEMNSVRNIRTFSSSSLAGMGTNNNHSKLTLVNPSSMKGLTNKSSWQLTSPTDTNIISPTKALKRKYKSRSTDEFLYENL